MTPPKYTMTNESISIYWDGKMHTVQKGTANFMALKKAINEENWDAIPKNLTIANSLNDYVKGKFSLTGGTLKFDGKDIPYDLGTRIKEMATKGEDPTPLFKFWEKLQKNPSYRSVHQLWGFLNQKGIPFTKDGNFLAYKSVRQDYRDHHSGQWTNKPGVINEMPRNQISDDPEVACHEGFHVGALEYAKTFGSNGRIVVCEIDPANVVCVPHDHSQQKMRVCKYKVIGNHNGQFMDSTVHEDTHDAKDSDLEKVEVKTTPEEKTEKSNVVRAKAPKKKEYAKFDKMGLEGLMGCSLDELRQYAGKGLEITGASKIPGGKAALVAKILEARK